MSDMNNERRKKYIKNYHYKRKKYFIKFGSYKKVEIFKF